MLKVKKYCEFNRIPLKDRQQDAMKTLMMWLWMIIGTWIKHWLWCGTFLWLYRDWKFIDWDLDLDISATYDYNNYENIELKIMEAFKEWKLIRTIHYDWRPFQIAFLSPLDVILDFTFYVSWIKEWKLVSYSDCWIVEEDEYLFNWIVPCPSEEYLEKRYWDDWDIPDWWFRAWNTYCKTLIK